VIVKPDPVCPSGPSRFLPARVWDSTRAPSCTSRVGFTNRRRASPSEAGRQSSTIRPIWLPTAGGWFSKAAQAVPSFMGRLHAVEERSRRAARSLMGAVPDRRCYACSKPLFAGGAAVFADAAFHVRCRGRILILRALKKRVDSLAAQGRSSRRLAPGNWTAHRPPPRPHWA